MNYKDIQQIAIIYGQKPLIEELLENLEIASWHDDAPLKAILLQGEIKKELKKWVWKGD